MFRQNNSNPFMYSKNIYYYSFENISDVRNNLPLLKDRLIFDEDQEHIKIMGFINSPISVEKMVERKGTYFFKDSSIVGAITYRDRVKDILDRSYSINGFVFSEAYKKDEGFLIYDRFESLLIFAVDPDINESGPDEPDLPRIQLPTDESGVINFYKWLCLNV